MPTPGGGARPEPRLREDRDPAEGWLQRDGVRLHYLEWPVEDPSEGDGTDLLLLHGLSANARYWERLARRLPHRRVVALDQRSHGSSDRPAAGYRPEDLAADAAAAIEAAGLERPVVAGHSWGVTTALTLAAARPRLVSGLALVDGPVLAMSERLRWEDAARLMQPPLPSYRSLEEAYEESRRHVGQAWGPDLEASVRAGLVRDGEAWVLPLTAEVRLEVLRRLYEFQPQLLLPQVASPILAALARDDSPMRQVREESARLLAELQPTADVRWYDSRHDIPQIRPDGLAADLERLCLRAGFREVARQAAGAAGAFQAPSPLPGWNAKDLLAHLSSTQAAMPAVILAEPASAPEAAAGRPAFDPDRWNESQVRRRRERTPAELVAEIEAATREIDAALRRVDLDRPLALGNFAGRPVGSGMRAMIRHQRGHLAELRRALAGSSVG